MISITASALPQLFLCPGAHWAQQGLPFETSDAAEEGKLLHEAMERAGARLPMPKLTAAQERDIETCRLEGNSLYQRFFSHEDAVPTIVREKLGRCYISENLELRYKMDVLVWALRRCLLTATTSGKGLIIDYKFGRGDVDSADASMQGRGYAVAAQIDYKVDTVVFAIIQPRADRENRTTLCEYGPAELTQARQELIALGERIKQSKGVHTPSPDACRYCRAAGTERCPESQQAVMTLAKVGVVPTGEKMSELLRVLEIAKHIEPQAREHARQQLEADPDSIPGWGLSPSAPVREIESAEAAWLRAQSLIPAADFMRACKVGVGALEDVVRQVTGCKVKEQRERTNELLGDAIKSVPRQAALRRVK